MEGISHHGAFGKEDSKEIVPVVRILIAQVSQTPADISLQRSTLAKHLRTSSRGPAVCDICLT